jgi:hypothetical protein
MRPSEMFERIITALSVAIAVLAGAVLAVHSPPQASGATETLIWKAGTFESSTDNLCFGGGWHDTGSWAADIFEDADGPCSDLLGDSTVWADNYGKTTLYSSYYLLGHGFDGDSVYTGCEDVFVDVFWYNGSWSYIGAEWYKHVVSTNDDWYNIYIGYNTWSPSWMELGVTVDPDEDENCTSTAFHVHQTIGGVMYVNVQKNTGFSNHTEYYRHDESSFIHKWSAWDE